MTHQTAVDKILELRKSLRERGLLIASDNLTESNDDLHQQMADLSDVVLYLLAITPRGGKDVEV